MSKHLPSPECVLYVCCGSKCKKRGGKELYRSLKTEVKERKLKRIIQVIKTGCTDRCKHGPILAVMPRNEWYLNVDEHRGKRILDDVLKRDEHHPVLPQDLSHFD